MNVNSYLNILAIKATIKNNEKEWIQKSIEAIFQRLKNYDRDKNRIDKKFIFGSYKRGTIISRYFDNNSDIDIMVVFGKKFGGFYNFDPANEIKKPQTYLNYLKDFAESNYPRSEIYQSYPTIVLELNHIKFELVPAISDIFGNFKIPNKQDWYQIQDWIFTNPSDLDGILKSNCNLKRLVIIAKVWNAKQGYIYPSYELEKWITQQYFCGNLAEFFYSFCELLPIDHNLSQEKINIIKKIKESAKNAKIYNDSLCIESLFEYKAEPVRSEASKC